MTVSRYAGEPAEPAMLVDASSIPRTWGRAGRFQLALIARSWCFQCWSTCSKVSAGISCSRTSAPICVCATPLVNLAGQTFTAIVPLGDLTRAALRKRGRQHRLRHRGSHSHGAGALPTRSGSSSLPCPRSSRSDTDWPPSYLWPWESRSSSSVLTVSPIFCRVRPAGAHPPSQPAAASYRRTAGADGKAAPSPPNSDLH